MKLNSNMCPTGSYGYAPYGRIGNTILSISEYPICGFPIGKRLLYFFNLINCENGKMVIFSNVRRKSFNRHHFFNRFVFCAITTQNAANKRDVCSNCDSDFILRNSAFPEFKNFINMLNSVFPMEFSVTNGIRMRDVFLMSYPFKVLRSIIGFDSIFVIYLWFVFRVWNECLCNKAMNIFKLPLSVVRKTGNRISIFATSKFKRIPFTSRISREDNSIVADIISVCFPRYCFQVHA